MAARDDKLANAKQIAQEAVEDLLCNSRLIKDICHALGCNDPEGVAPYLDTQRLIEMMGQMIVENVVAAGHKSPRAKDFPVVENQAA